MTTKHHKIVAITQIKNELSKGHLERFFKYLPGNVDEMVVYDDVSTDGSYEYAKKFTPHVLKGVNNSFVNEWKIKETLVKKALTLKPDFILLIDADEVLGDENGERLQELAKWVTEKDLDGALIHDINLWRSTSWKRTDSDFDSAWFPRFWRVSGRELTYTNRHSGLHQTPTPDQIVNMKKQEIVSFLHFGFYNENSIVTKYINYASHGQKGEDLARFINEEKLLKTEKVPQSIYPKNLYKEDRQPEALSCLSWYTLIEQNKPLVKKPSISIVCLIYKSTSWLEFVYNQVVKYTDLSDKEFFFIANDATDDVKRYLKNNYIPHYIFDSTAEQKSEWYINGVYRAYNYGAEKAQGDFILFINSDMAFTPNWVENALAHYDGTNCVCSRLVQNDKLYNGEDFKGIEKNFGYDIAEYREEEFQEFAKTASENKLIEGGSFMPLLIKRNDFLSIGGYPEGNVVPGSDYFKPIIAKKGEPLVSGDAVFMEKLKTIGIRHTTANDSLSYHFQEGEKQDIEDESVLQKPLVVLAVNSLKGQMREKVLWDFMLERLPRITGIDEETVGANELNYSEKGSAFIQENYKDARIIIQNATFMDFLSPQHYTISYLQDDLRRMKRFSPQQEETLSLSQAYVSNSTYTAASYPEYLFDIIPIGIDMDLFKPGSKTESRKKYSIPQDKKVGIFVGDLSEVKGWMSVKKIIEKRSDIHFIVVTKGNEHYERENVTFYSRIPQSLLSELHQASDFFILGSPVETLCLAAMEACASNVPVIMNNTGIFAGFTEEEKNRCGIFGEDFEKAIDSVSSRTFSGRDLLIEKKLDINNTIELWWNLIARTRLINKQTNEIPQHLYTKKAKIRRKIKRIFSKNFIIVISKRNLPGWAYQGILNAWRISKRIIKKIQ